MFISSRVSHAAAASAPDQPVRMAFRQTTAQGMPGDISPAGPHDQWVLAATSGRRLPSPPLFDAVRASRVAHSDGPAGVCAVTESLQVTFTRRIIEPARPAVSNGSYSTGSAHWQCNLYRIAAGTRRANAAKLIGSKRKSRQAEKILFRSPGESPIRRVCAVLVPGPFGLQPSRSVAGCGQEASMPRGSFIID